MSMTDDTYPGTYDEDSQLESKVSAWHEGTLTLSSPLVGNVHDFLSGLLNAPTDPTEPHAANELDVAIGILVIRELRDFNHNKLVAKWLDEQFTYLQGKLDEALQARKKQDDDARSKAATDHEGV